MGRAREAGASRCRQGAREPPCISWCSRPPPGGRSRCLPPAAATRRRRRRRRPVPQALEARTPLRNAVFRLSRAAVAVEELPIRCGSVELLDAAAAHFRCLLCCRCWQACPQPLPTALPSSRSYLDARDTSLARLRQLSHSPAAWVRCPFAHVVLVSCLEVGACCWIAAALFAPAAGLRQCGHVAVALSSCYSNCCVVSLVALVFLQYEDYKRDLRLRLRAMADTETAAPGQPELLFV